jgi:acetylornithine/N-succinyldiaminopimelate aminotransferase
MLMNTYNRFPVTFVKGYGCRLYDEADKAYLDFSSGIGVTAVGHSHPRWVEAVTKQASLLAHTSNLYHTQPAAQLAEKLAELSGLKSVFFANSGAEANEGMFKMARKYSSDKYGDTARHVIVTLKNSFHGRTITTLAATGQDVFHRNFNPLTPGFMHVKANDFTELAAVAKESGSKICAVLLEPVQGEGGVLPLTADYVEKTAQLCKERDWLLLFDEVQTGIGRTGAWFAFQHYNVKPDGISFAKGIAGGLPLGGFIAANTCADTLGHGDHATTYGGNPVACAAALATIEIISEILPELRQKSEKIINSLNGIQGLHDVRGAGLMLGATVDHALGSPRALAEELLKNGLICLTASNDTLRLLPPLIISDAEIDEGMEILEHGCKSINAKLFGGLCGNEG